MAGGTTVDDSHGCWYWVPMIHPDYPIDDQEALRLLTISQMGVSQAIRDPPHHPISIIYNYSFIVLNHPFYTDLVNGVASRSPSLSVRLCL